MQSLIILDGFVHLGSFIFFPIWLTEYEYEGYRFSGTLVLWNSVSGTSGVKDLGALQNLSKLKIKI